MNKSFIAIVGVLVFALLYFLAPILTPFVVGILLAYLFNPVVNLLMRLHLPRIVAVIVVFLVIALIIMLLVVLLIPLIQTQVVTLSVFIPNTAAWLQNTIVPLLKAHFGIEQIIDINTLKQQLTDNLAQAGGAATWVVVKILHSGVALLHLILNLVLIPVVTFYLLFDWNKVLKGLKDLLPRKYKSTIIKLATECNDVLGAFFRGQLLVMLTLGIFYSLGLSLIGLQIGLVIGVVVGVLSIVPYLGIIVGIIVASIAAYLQFGTFISVVPVLLLFAVGQTLDGMFITPKLVGGRIGLHPVAVIFAVLAGGTLFGFFGVLLALPVASIIMVLARFFNQRYQSSPLYK